MDNSASASGSSHSAGREWIRVDSSPIEVDPSPGDEPSFTFITHNDDLQTKRIRDATARKQIRSHVMRDVRRRERIAGLRRPSKKERATKDSRAPSLSDPSPVPSPRTPAKIHEDEGLDLDDSFGSVVASIEDEPATSANNHTPLQIVRRTSSQTEDKSIRKRSREEELRSLSWSQGQSKTPRLTKTPGLEFKDPFDSLPETRAPSRIVDLLLKHCSEVFLPMTFPVESNNMDQINSRIHTLMQMQLSNRATFYATMAMAAAHRAMLHGRPVNLNPFEGGHIRVPNDPDYYIMHDQALKEVNLKMKDPKTAVELETFQSVMFLASAAVLVGNFSEAGTHLDGLAQMAKLRGGLFHDATDSNSPMFHMLVSDIKAAVGMSSQSRLAFTATYDTLDEALHRKITPSPSSELHRFATAFRPIASLSRTLVEILESVKDTCFLQEFNFNHESGLTPTDHDSFRRRVLTIEHSLLDYAFKQFPSSTKDPNKLQIPFIEAVTRISALAYMSASYIVASPNSGLGRSLTLQMQRLLSTFEGHYQDLPVKATELLTWSACMSIGGAAGQKEEQFFHDHFRVLLSIRRWKHWQEFNDVMKGFLYIPRLQEESWRKMFEKAGSSRRNTF